MATPVARLQTCCPLCGDALLSVGRGGRVIASSEVHPVPVYRRGGVGEGFLLCDHCGLLAELGAGLTLN